MMDRIMNRINESDCRVALAAYGTPLPLTRVLLLSLIIESYYWAALAAYGAPGAAYGASLAAYADHLDAGHLKRLPFIRMQD